MNDAIFPAGGPDILNDHGWVQFFHRWIAMATGPFILAYAYRIKSIALTAAVVTQVSLGILTLLSQVWIPLATLHQAGALILLGILLYEIHKRRV